MRFPLEGPIELLHRLRSLLLQGCGRLADYLFPATLSRAHLPDKPRSNPTHNPFVKQSNAELQILPPKGMKFTPHSLRSGGLTAAYSVGFPLERIPRFSGHETDEIIFKHYIDVLTPTTSATRTFFGHLVPPKTASAVTSSSGIM